MTELENAARKLCEAVEFDMNGRDGRGGNGGLMSDATLRACHEVQAILNAMVFVGNPRNDISFADLRTANVARQDEWCPDQKPDLWSLGNELAGETGEACNVIKKIERERHGWAGSRSTLDDLADELADVIITAELVAATAGIYLGVAVIRKFNATSDKVGLKVKIDR